MYQLQKIAKTKKRNAEVDNEIGTPATLSYILRTQLRLGNDIHT